MSDQNKDPKIEDATVLNDSEDHLELPESYKNKFGTIIPTSMTQEMEKSYLDYAMSVIVSRALPDVRDGLKPVHRRILYAMKGLGLTHNTSYKKSARIVGEVLGKYHPHGDTAVYDALVRLAQDFSMRYPLVDGQGNFGSIDGDSAAAMRYTEARMSSITEELLVDLDKNTVLFTENFDGSTDEPTVLPAKLPNLLLMGADGIAVGMATKIPPHNLNEVCDAAIELINQGKSVDPKRQENPDDMEAYLESCPADELTGTFTSEASVDDLLVHIQGPDFPTGGIIYDWNAIKEAYITGKGKIVTRGVADIEETKQGRFKIVITELPYQVNKARLVAKIADLVKNKKIDGIADLRDESDRQGMRVVVLLKRDAKPKSVLNNLYKYTQLQDTFSANIVALNADGAPQLMHLKMILNQYVGHRQLVVVRRAQHELKTARARAHILEGLLIALDHLDEVISIIRNSPDAEVAKERLMSKFNLSQLQAVAILDMQLRKLAALERKKIEEEYQAIMARIKELVSLLTSPDAVLQVIVDELTELKAKYGDKRRTKVVKAKIGEFSEADLVASEDVIIAVTKSGYIKRVPQSTYRSQRRGGQGVSGMTTKNEDSLAYLLTANTHDNMLIFTNLGKVYKLNVYEIPEGSRQAKGQAIINLINLSQGEFIKAIVTASNELMTSQEMYIVLATRKGMIKKTSVKDFQNIRTNGIIAIVLKDGDELVWGSMTDGKQHIVLISFNGKSIRFAETDIRPTARDTQGVRGMLLKNDDYVVAAQSIPANPQKPEDKRRKFFLDLLLISQRGIGKRTATDDYPLQKRGGQGVMAAKVSEKTGKIACALLVTHEHEEIVITTTKAQVIKLPLRNIPQLKRPTQGVILMRMADKDDLVTAVTSTKQSEAEADIAGLSPDSL